MPERGINALDALVTAYQSIAQLRQHIRPTERVHGIFTEAGDAPNIVPERAAGRFYVRARDTGASPRARARTSFADPRPRRPPAPRRAWPEARRRSRDRAGARHSRTAKPLSSAR
jgi:hypothetical protein